MCFCAGLTVQRKRTSLQVGSSLVSEVRRGRPMAQTGNRNQEVVTLRTVCQVVFLALILWKLCFNTIIYEILLLLPTPTTVMTRGSWTASSTEQTLRWSKTLSRGHLSRPSSSGLVLIGTGKFSKVSQLSTTSILNMVRHGSNPFFIYVGSLRELPPGVEESRKGLTPRYP